jgi:membrane associated rhomboid family serine protease
MRAGAQPPLRQREPIFNVPGVVLALLTLFAAIHVLRWALPPDQEAWWTAALAFIPARCCGFAADLPGGKAAAFTSYLTHLFVHGDVMHLVINSAWLLAFGTPVARRTDTVRFLLFFAVAGITGALLYLTVNGAMLTLMVGASGAISGLMGAAFRFMFRSFEQGGPWAFAGTPIHVPLASLSETLRDRRIVTAVIAWTVINMVLAWGGLGLGEAAGIAWEAHLGGFFSGLLLYGLFDRPPSDGNNEDVALAG